MGLVEHRTATTSVELHDLVELTTDVFEAHSGSRGTVVDAYPDRDTYTVEISDESGRLVALVPCHRRELRVIERYH